MLVRLILVADLCFVFDFLVCLLIVLFALYFVGFLGYVLIWVLLVWNWCLGCLFLGTLLVGDFCLFNWWFGYA